MSLLCLFVALSSLQGRASVFITWGLKYMFLIKVRCPTNISNILCKIWKWSKYTTKHVERKSTQYVHNHANIPVIPFWFSQLHLEWCFWFGFLYLLCRYIVMSCEKVCDRKTKIVWWIHLNPIGSKQHSDKGWKS